MTKRLPNTKSPELNLIWDDLQDIFIHYKKFNKRIIPQLEKLGFECKYTSAHLKVFMIVKGKKYCVTIASTPSDNYAGSMILKQFRRIYENG